ncbi:LRR receptor-like kinase [Medicago truncatula]|uniref:LRR receptor-like kinase n=1 Tax=Medicago truncatula TaxID=3880 RepID=A0A072U897_MEDTR|nr:LRR receptor-like kinase [Medicago truncatula]
MTSSEAEDHQKQELTKYKCTTTTSTTLFLSTLQDKTTTLPAEMFLQDGNEFEDNSSKDYTQIRQRITGPIPPFLKGSTVIDLSKNKFSDSLPFLCANGIDAVLGQFDLPNNQLSGQIPDCWSNFKSLAYLDLSQNNFSGKIPTSMGSLVELQALLLRNNSLTGEIPFSLMNCTKLIMLDLKENRLDGLIPYWIGRELKELQVLSLQRNHFFGNLPFELCHLQNIQLFDLSLNNLSRRIPKCIKNFTSMTQKGSSQGKIPSNFGKLTSLDFLDLSRNNLLGSIPPSLSHIDRLSVLDLSHNQLSGEIPTSTQLQSFNATSYEDNLDLCGPPLVKLCAQEEPQHKLKVEIQDDEDLLLNRGFYISLTFGFIIGFWGVFGSILIKRSWRHAYFRFMNNLGDSIYMKCRWWLKD